MKRADELAKLFSDARLEPDRRFVRSLHGRLTAPQSRRAVGVRRLGLRVLAPVAAGLVIALAVVGLTLVRPAPKPSQKTESKGTILISKLYGMATADALPQQSAITFWDITQTAMAGPMAADCHVYLSGPNPPIRSLLFKDGNVTAAWSKPPEMAASMSYSEDPEIPAFDTGALSASQDFQVRSALMDVVLTDQNGKPLPGDATTALKQTGSYDLYATQATRLKDDSGPMPDCPVQFIHLRIDAVTGMFTELDVYNGTMADDKLAFKLTQVIATGTGDFAAELPKFTAVGFNLQQAKNNQAQIDSAHVVNTAAGYGFFYRKSVMGADSMTEIKAADGGVAAYSYRFAKQSKVVYRFYTSKADNQQPKDMAALQAMAQVKGWQVLMDDKQPGIQYPGYPKAPTETYVATDGATVYGMFATGTPDVPYVYAETPESGGDISFLLQQVMLFTPGGQPTGL